MAESDRVPELIDRYLNGTIAADELRDLNRALEADPSAVDKFWAAAEIDSLLENHFGNEPRRAEMENRLTKLTMVGKTRRRTVWLVAASLLVAVGGMALWQWNREAFPRNDVISGRVLVDGTQSGAIVEGAPVVVWGDAPAVIRLSDGSQAELDPESEVVVHGGGTAARQVVELLSGSGSFHVPKGERRFRVDTAVGSVTSADTDFSIDFLRSHAEGEEDVRIIPASIAALVVSVAAGIVQVDVQNQSFTLSSGESRVFASAPNDAKEKKGAVPVPPGDLLGFEYNGKSVALERTFPGIRSALLLTDEQKRQFDAAQKETVQSESVRAAGASIKGSPEAKAEEKEKAKQVVAAARKELLEKAAGILTEDQKALVKKLNTAAAESQTAVAERLREDLKDAKGDKTKADEVQQKMRESLIAELKTRAAKFLTPEQLAALEKGVEEQKAAEERAKNDPKNAKVKKP
jgi:hypothetical protein